MAAETLRSICPLDCPDACSLEVKVEGGRVVGVDGSHDNPLTEGFICAKVRRFPEHMYGPERVLHPAVRDGREGQRARSATSAGTRRSSRSPRALGRRARSVRRRGDPAVLLRRLERLADPGRARRAPVSAARRVAPRCARSARRRPAPRRTVSTARCPASRCQDYEHARLIVLWGVQPVGVGHPPRARPSSGARQRGARLVVVDPRRTPLARQADLHLALRPGTDLPVALSLISLAVRERARRSSVSRRARDAAPTSCGPAPRPGRSRAPPRRRASPPRISRRFARLYADASPAVIRCGWGLERNRNGGSAVAAILALPAVAGKFGVRGGGYTMSNSRGLARHRRGRRGRRAPSRRRARST